MLKSNTHKNNQDYGEDMIIETKFCNGDSVYAVAQLYRMGHWEVRGPMTVGQVRVAITDSPGREGEEIFDNYMPKNERTESYMCVETGIGTGQVHYADRLFHTRSEAEEAAQTRNAAIEESNERA